MVGLRKVAIKAVRSALNDAYRVRATDDQVAEGFGPARLLSDNIRGWKCQSG